MLRKRRYCLPFANERFLMGGLGTPSIMRRTETIRPSRR